MVDNRRNLARRRAWFASADWLSILFLIVLAVLPVWRVLIGEIFLPLDIVPHLHPWRFSYERVGINNAANSDIVQQVYPRRVLANAIIRQGAWPLWNPTILTGTPLLADGQLILFYPLSLLFLLLPLEQSFGYYAIAQLILAGTGSYLFARRLDLDRGAATLTGVCYMFSGYLLSWLQFPHHAGAMAMLPWCFWAIDQACARQRVGSWLLGGVVLALPLLAHIQLSFYIYVGVGCLLLARLIMLRSAHAIARLVLGFGVALVVALGASAVQLLPQFALSAQGQRADQVSEPLSAELQWTTLLRLVLPLIGGEPRTAPTNWGPTLIEAPQPYAGLAPLVLVGVALLLSRHRLSTLFGLLAIGSFALALRTPLLDLLVLLVPPYRQFADHNRWFALWGFAMAVLAGMGAQAWAGAHDPPNAAERRTLVINRGLLVALLLLLIGWGWQHLALWTPQSRYGTYITIIRQQPLGAVAVLGTSTIVAVGLLALRRVPLLLRWIVVLVVVASDVLWYGGTYNTTADRSVFVPTADLTQGLAVQGVQPLSDGSAYPLSRQIAFLQAQPQPFRILGGDYPVFLPNLATTFGLEDVRGYQSLYLARYNRLARLIDGRDYTQLASEGGSSLRPYLTSAYTHRRLLDMLNVEYLLFPPGSENPARYQPLELVHESDEGTIYRNPNVLPRAWLVHQAEVIADDDQQLARLAQPDFDPAQTAIVPEAIPALDQPSAPESITALRYAPNQLTLNASVSAPALLLVSDAYTDDWRATIDGQPATLHRANYALRGVWLPPGQHTVVFRYQPRSFLIGGVLSLATLAVVAGYGVWQWRRDRTRTASDRARASSTRPGSDRGIPGGGAGSSQHTGTTAPRPNADHVRDQAPHV